MKKLSLMFAAALAVLALSAPAFARDPSCATTTSGRCQDSSGRTHWACGNGKFVSGAGSGGPGMFADRCYACANTQASLCTYPIGTPQPKRTKADQQASEAQEQ